MTAQELMTLAQRHIRSLTATIDRLTHLLHFVRGRVT